MKPKDGHRTVTDTAVDQTVTNGHGCSRNRTVGVQSAIGTVPTGFIETDNEDNH